MQIKLWLMVLVAAFLAGCAAKMLPSKEPRAVSPLQFAQNEWRVPSQAIVIADSSGTTYVSGTFPYIKALTQFKSSIALAVQHGKATSDTATFAIPILRGRHCI